MSDAEMAASPKPEDVDANGVDFGSDDDEPAKAADGLGDELFGPDAVVQPAAAAAAEDPVLPPHLRAPAPSTIPQQYAAEAAAAEYLETDEAPQEAEELKEAEFGLYTFPRPEPTDGRVWHVRLPNFLRIETDEFNADGWDADKERAAVEAVDVARANLQDDHIVRWRTGADGQRESNARIVKWDDGSMSLQVGRELYDIQVDAERVAGPVGDDLSGLSRRAAALDDDVKPADISASARSLTYIVAEHPYLRLLETQANVTGTMSMTPTSFGTNASRRAGLASAALAAKPARATKLATMDRDPEQEKLARVQAEKERKKAERKAKREAGGGGSRRRKGVSGRSRAIGSSSEEEDEDEDDEDESPRKGAGGRRNARSARFVAAEDEEDEAQFIASEDEEPDQTVASRKKGGETTAPDELDELEAAAERARRAAKQGKTADAPMDVDAPAADEPFKRKRMIIDSDEED